MGLDIIRGDMLNWQGPYQFYRCFRNCRECRTELVSHERLNLRHLSALLGAMGMTAHCSQCATRYRAFEKLPFQIAFWIGMGINMIALLLIIFFLMMSTSVVIKAALVIAAGAVTLQSMRSSFLIAERLWWACARMEKIYQSSDSLSGS